MTTPYSDLPDTAFWNRTMALRHPSGFDPIVETGFALRDRPPIATMGSCFAQHLARWLKAHGREVLMTDTGLPAGRREDLLFSANYGNTYTVAQALNLMRAAIGEFQFDDEVWTDGNGRFRDPIRPLALDGVFDRADQVSEARSTLLNDVRRLLRDQKCLVFTLGLTEAWIRNSDGAALPTAPGVIGNSYVAGDYRFVNFEYPEIVDDLRAMLALMRRFNPDLRVILTVSPVPLAATAEPRHVAVSSMASKAILRAAVDKVVREDPLVDYFPSFELFYTPGVGGRYFDMDGRHVLDAGVAHAMRLFSRHYLEEPGAAKRTPLPFTPAQIAENYTNIICDEDLIDPAASGPT